MAAINRLWAVGAAVVVVAVLLMGWFLGASPRFTEINDNDTLRDAAEATNIIQEANLARIKEQFENLDELKAELAEMQQAVPAKNSLSTFLGQLNEIEAAAAVSITNITATDAVPFELALSPTAVVPPVEGETPVAPTQTLPSEEFVIINIGLTVRGGQAELLNFVDSLQLGTRLFLITGLVINGNPTDGYSAVIEGYVYVLIDPNAPQVDEEEIILEEIVPEPSASPSASPAPSSSPSPSATPTP